MTSCSYHHVSVTSLRQARVACLHYHHYKKETCVTLCPSFKSEDARTSLFSQACSKQHCDRVKRFHNREKENNCEIKSVCNKDGNKEYASVSSPYHYHRTTCWRPQLGNNFLLPLNSSLLDLTTQFVSTKMKRNMYLIDTDLFSGKIPDVLCSPAHQLEKEQLPHKNLNIAPAVFRNVSVDKVVHDNVGAELSCLSAGKDCESSWSAFKSTTVFPTDRIARFFHAVYNHQKYRDFLIGKSYLGRSTMSLSLLLDPIVGSPPSNLSSPIIEARDDITALSEGLNRKVKLFRRRLSTSFDEPLSTDDGKGRGIAISTGKAIVEYVEPFAFKGDSKILEDDSAEKKAKINEWLTRLHDDALVKAKSSVSDSNSSKNDGTSSFGSDDDDRSNRVSPVGKISEDLFQLLEKVIGFKGRNISHITVEQSVKDLCTVYMDVGEDDKLKFFMILAEKYGVDHDNVCAAATNLGACKDSDVRLTLEEKLRGSLVPKSQWLFTQIGRLENGVKFLVDLRTDLLDAIEKSQGTSSLKALNNSLRDLIGMWFNVGFLNLERVTWQSSCDMLQKISEYEAVHPMRNWTDLKKRVGPNRRCFVFTHNSMPGEPVVVLHTFLTDHIPATIKKIVSNNKMRMMSLDSELPMTSNSEDPEFISTAVFYSITSTQRGLTGIELGNYIIKRVVRELQSEFPKMTQYSSLSPIPGFTKWLISSIRTTMKDPSTSLLTKKEMDSLRPLFNNHREDKSFYQVFLDLLKLNSWYTDERLVKELEKPLMRLCAEYLFLVKRRGYALDPVAHFHLKNGAVMWRLNWLGDDSPRGLGQSCGMMVNYRYFLDACETNSQNYMENQIIQISDQVKRLAKSTESHL